LLAHHVFLKCMGVLTGGGRLRTPLQYLPE